MLLRLVKSCTCEQVRRKLRRQLYGGAIPSLASVRGEAGGPREPRRCRHVLHGRGLAPAGMCLPRP